MEWSKQLRAVNERFRALGLRFRLRLHEAWERREFPRDVWLELARAGLVAAATRERFGDRRGVAWYAAALEGLTYGTMDGAFTISAIVQGAMGVPIIDGHGSAEVRARYLPALTSGEAVLAFAVTEPHGGTDALRPRTELTPQADGSYVLCGQKWHITNAPFTDLILAWARESSTGVLVAALVDARWPGVSVSAPFRLASARTSPVGSITFDHVDVPATHIIGLPRDGQTILKRALLTERMLAAFPAIGAMEALRDHALEFSRRRRVFGKSIRSYQHIQRRLTDLQIALDTVRALAHATLHKFLAGDDISLESSLLKMVAARSTLEASTNVIQLCGSYGLQDEAHLYPVLLDALAVTIGGGTEEAHRSIIVAEMVKRRSVRATCGARMSGAASCRCVTIP
jgi:alkylation response protein AidB-like acyl-CoA dehydrogenase